MRRMARVLLASLAVLLCAEIACANTHLHPGLRDGSSQMQVAREFSMGSQSGFRRSLLQSSPSYSGQTTATGLLIYTPVGRQSNGNGALDPDDFGNFFQQAYFNNAVPGIFLTPGNYTVNSAYDYTVKPWQFYMGCAGANRVPQFELNMEGSKLYMGTYNQGAFGWDQCANLYWHGAAMTYAAGQQPFTQGTVTAITPTAWTIRIDPGYPTYRYLQGSTGHLCSLYAANGNLVQNASEVYAGAFTAASADGQTWTFQMTYTIPDARVGQRMAIRGDTPASHMNFMNAVRNMRVANTAIYQSNIFAVADNNGYNSSYNNVSVIPDPAGIPGTSNPALFSTNADGIHVTLPRYGPQITNCLMRNTGDDAIAVHGQYAMVAQINSAKSIIVAVWNCYDVSCLFINVGDSLLQYSPRVQNLGYATVTATANAAQPANARGYSNNAPQFDYDTAAYFQLNFTSLPTAWRNNGGFDGYVTVSTENGNQASVSGNVVGNNRARGIFFKGMNSVVNNNRVVGSALMGILMVPDTFFLESDFVMNVTVANNFVNVTGGGIIITAFNVTRQPGFYQNHRNVRITGNTIQGAMHPLIVGGATGFTVSSNKIIDGSCYQYMFNDLMFNQTSSRGDNSGVPKGALSYTSWTTSSSYASSNTFTISSTPAAWRAACNQYGNYVKPYQKGLGVSTSVTFPNGQS